MSPLTVAAMEIGVERTPLLRSSAFRRRLLHDGTSQPAAGVIHAARPDDLVGECGVRLAGVISGGFLESPYRRCPACETLVSPDHYDQELRSA